MCIYIYVYMNIYIYHSNIYIYVYMYICRKRESNNYNPSKEECKLFPMAPSIQIVPTLGSKVCK